MDTDRIVSFFVGLLSGSVVGAAVVLLLAPHSGSQTRQLVVDTANEILEAGRQGFFIFYYRNGMAALLTLARYKNHAIWQIDWTPQWEFVQKLI